MSIAFKLLQLKWEEKLKQNKEEIYVPNGYSLDELMETDDSEYAGEKPIVTGEVELRYE